MVRLTPEELAELIRKGEGVRLEFKTKDILSDKAKLAREMVALANTDGGKILIGVNDNGRIEGIKGQEKDEERLINIARDKCNPPISPSFEIVKTSQGDVYAVTVPKFEDYPYAVKTSSGGVYFIRVGSTIREPTSSEMRAMFVGGKVIAQKLVSMLKRETVHNLELAKRIVETKEEARSEVLGRFFQRDAWELIQILQGKDAFGEPDIFSLCKNCYWRINQVNRLLETRIEKGGNFMVEKSTTVDKRILGVLQFLQQKLNQLGRRLDHVP